MMSLSSANTRNDTPKDGEKQVSYISKTTYLGLFLVLMGTLTLVFQPSKWYRNMKMTFSEGGEVFGLWMEPNVSPIMKLFVYNITNAEAFLDGRDSKIRLEEVGPYFYENKYVFKEPHFDHNEGTVTITPTDSYTWAPHLNNRSEDELLTVPNMAMLLTANQFAGKFGSSWVINTVTWQTGSQPIIKQSVRDLLWGAPNPYIKLGNTFMPNWVTFDKLGLFDRTSDLEGHTMTYYTGEKDYHSGGRLARYNNKARADEWQPPCDRMQGATDGKKWGNDISANETIWFYRKFVCRALPLVPKSPAVITEQGIPSIPFVYRDDAFDNGQRYPDNKCFCRDGRCLPSGVMDSAPCFFGFGTSLSLPHFYRGDKSLFDRIEGLNPDPELHDSVFNVNPDTGIMTSCSAKFQFNMNLGDLSDMTGCQRFSNLIMPMTWGEVSFNGLEENTAFKIFITIRILPILDYIFAASYLLVGCFLIVFRITYAKWSNKPRSPKLPINSTLNRIPTALKMMNMEAGSYLTLLLDSSKTSNV